MRNLEEAGQRDEEEHKCQCTSSGSGLVLKLGVFKRIIIMHLNFYMLYIPLCVLAITLEPSI